MKKQKVINYLKYLYYKTGNPASFVGINTLYDFARKKFPKLKRKQVKEWLSSQDVYTKFKPVRKKFTRNKMYATTIDEIWQCDLNYMANLSRHNNGYKYILTIIDCFSRYAFARPLKNRKPQTLVDAFKDVFKIRRPYIILTDKGGEFTGKIFKSFLDKEQIKFYTTQNDDVKAFLVERLNRTLKTRMWRYFEHKNTLKWVDKLDKFVESYNKSVHRALGRSPESVTESNVKVVWKHQFFTDGTGGSTNKNPFKFNVNDNVRVSKGNYKKFNKGFQQQWSSEIFKIIKRVKRQPPIYYIADQDGEEIIGSFYAEELQKINNKKPAHK